MKNAKVVIFDPDLLQVLKEEIGSGIRRKDFLQSKHLKIVGDQSKILQHTGEGTILLVHFSWLTGGVEWLKKNILTARAQLKIIIYTGAGCPTDLPLWCNFQDRRFLRQALEKDNPEEFAQIIINYANHTL